jgi:hypothetical protein
MFWNNMRRSSGLLASVLVIGLGAAASATPSQHALLDRIHQQIAQLKLQNPHNLTAKQARRVVAVLGADSKVRPVIDRTMQIQAVRSLRAGRNSNRRLSWTFGAAGLGSVVGGAALHLMGGTPHGIAMAGSGLGFSTGFALHHRSIAKSADRALDAFYIQAASDALSFVRQSKHVPRVPWWRKGQLRRLDRELGLK